MAGGEGESEAWQWLPLNPPRLAFPQARVPLGLTGTPTPAGCSLLSEVVPYTSKAEARRPRAGLGIPPSPGRQPAGTCQGARVSQMAVDQQYVVALPPMLPGTYMECQPGHHGHCHSQYGLAYGRGLRVALLAAGF